jgi:hypothetical protein
LIDKAVAEQKTNTKVRPPLWMETYSPVSAMAALGEDGKRKKKKKEIVGKNNELWIYA